MTQSAFIRNAVASIVLGFALSALFWLVWDVFVLSGFLIWSVAAGVSGALLAHILKRNMATALALTASIRIAIFVVLSGLWF